MATKLSEYLTEATTNCLFLRDTFLVDAVSDAHRIADHKHVWLPVRL